MPCVGITVSNEFYDRDNHLALQSCRFLLRMLLTIATTLQIRIEQVITARLPLVLCFKLSQLLAFYGRTVEQMVGGHAHLTQTLAECHTLATRVFHEQLKAQGSKLLQQVPAPNPQLSAPPQVCSSKLLSHLVCKTCQLRCCQHMQHNLGCACHFRCNCITCRGCTEHAVTAIA